jgi:hypothetical protein
MRSDIFDGPGWVRGRRTRLGRWSDIGDGDGRYYVYFRELEGEDHVTCRPNVCAWHGRRLTHERFLVSRLGVA